MKKILFHSATIAISMIWLVINHQTYNPFSLKGPEFLKFYLILLSGFYLSVFSFNYLRQTISNTTFYFMIVILVSGVIKITIGLFLGKPVGYLIILLIIQFIAMNLCGFIGGTTQRKI
ncbi:cytochrome b subunit of formate dehydrogenase [Sphingobacterium sp. BIGb0165]|nr:cytochrome b subunit of formate dehydrogenase [Sphingobacterium sp. BIGb0165]